MITSPEGVFLPFPCWFVWRVYHIHHFHFKGELLLTPGTLLVSIFVITIAWRPPPLVFSVELACLLEDPTTYVGMISWFIGVAVNLAGSVQYPV